MFRPSPRASLIAIAATCCALLLPAGAGAATVVNGDFETGNLSGWTVFNSTGNGDWLAYAGAETPISEKVFYAPPEGSWAAASDSEGWDSAILYQDVALEPHYSHSLVMTLYYQSFAPIFVPTPNTLTVEDEPGAKNQQLRVDVIKPTAPIDTLNPADILATVFANKNGDPQFMVPTVFSADLSALAGQTVRLRLANPFHDNIFNAGVDAVSISTTAPTPHSPPAPSPRTPSNEFTRGKLQLTPGTGGGFLPIIVPGPGTVVGVDARTRIATASANLKPVHMRIRRASKVSRAAGKVLLPLHPNNYGFEQLEEKGKLKVRVRVTYTPTGGTPNTKSFKVTLKLAPSGGGPGRH
jgi:hypothetical protein